MAIRITTSITIDQDVWTEAKIAAIRRRFNLAVFLDESIKERLEREGELNERK